MHSKVRQAFEQIDAALFNGDTFDEPEDRAVLQDYLKRWEKRLDDDAIYKRAVALGCKVDWYDGMIGWAWHCGCDDNRHGYDQQCSVITSASLDRAEDES